MSTSALRLVIAGGGTGGHLYPGIAVAEAVRERWPQADVRFLGAAGGIEARVLPEKGWPVWLLDLSRLRGLGLAGKFRSLRKLSVAVRQAAERLREFRPHAVLGVGGYASGAGILAAAWLGIFRAIHEQNAVAGFTNRVAGKLAHRVYVSFDAARASFPAKRTVVVGNPVRASLEHTTSGALRMSAAPSSATDPLHLLVVGGSQGSRFLNDRVPDLAQILASKRRLAVRHQSGEADTARVCQAYRAAGVDASVEPYIDDMAAAYAWAHVAVCRAGAGTVSELAAVGLPAVLVPFPHAAGDHQTANALALVNAGAGWLAPEASFDAAAIAELLSAEALNESALAHRAALARSQSHRGAAAALVEDLAECLQLRGAWVEAGAAR